MGNCSQTEVISQMGRLIAVRVDYRASEIGRALEDARTGLTVGEFVAGLGVTRYQYRAVCTGKLNGRTANRLLSLLDSRLEIQGQPIVVRHPPRLKFKAAGNVRRALRTTAQRLQARREGTTRFWDHVDKQAEHWLGVVSRQRVWQRRHPDAPRASETLNSVCQRMGLVRPPCVLCGNTEGIEGHHPDYSKRLTVAWLCQKCHVALHVILRNNPNNARSLPTVTLRQRGRGRPRKTRDYEKVV